MLKIFFTSLVFLITVSQAQAYYTFQDTGSLLAPGEKAVGGELQFKTSDNSGTNILGRYDGGWKDDFNYRFLVGLGKIDFQAGAFVKWVPFPDHDKQPAIGVSFGGLLASFDNDTEFAFRAIPFASKEFEVEFGQLTPYAAFPLGIRTYDGEEDSTAQFVLGSKYVHPDQPGAHYFAEFGIDIDDAFSYISFGATFPLNENNRIDIWDEE